LIVKQTGRVSGNRGVWGDVFCHNATGADNRVFADRHAAKQRRAGTDRGAASNDGSFATPVLFRLQVAIAIRCTRILVVDKSNAVPDEDVVADGEIAGNVVMGGAFYANRDIALDDAILGAFIEVVGGNAVALAHFDDVADHVAVEDQADGSALLGYHHDHRIRFLADAQRSAMAATHNSVYHHGKRPGAIQTIGASTAATVATPGANHGEIPRRAPRVVAPAAAPASNTETAARNSGISQINHRDASTPCWGM